MVTNNELLILAIPYFWFSYDNPFVTSLKITAVHIIRRWLGGVWYLNYWLVLCCFNFKMKSFWLKENSSDELGSNIFCPRCIMFYGLWDVFSLQVYVGDCVSNVMILAILIGIKYNYKNELLPQFLLLDWLELRLRLLEDIWSLQTWSCNL